MIRAVRAVELRYTSFTSEKCFQRFTKVTSSKFFRCSFIIFLILSTEYCLPNWKYFRGSCYFFSTTSKSWEAAKTTCVGSSASLVNIGSKKENDFIAANTESERWIGLKEIPGNKMNWTNDHTNSGYVAWKAGEPAYEVTRTECASLSKSSGNWYTVSCDEELDFICEKGKIFGFALSAVRVLILGNHEVGMFEEFPPPLPPKPMQ